MTAMEDTRHRDMGLLMLRLGVGVLALVEGASILMAGPLAWLELGEGMQMFGFPALPEYWGVLFGTMYLAGGLFFALGLLHRLSTLVLLLLTTFYVSIHLYFEAGWASFAGLAQWWILFAAFLFIGPGRYALDGMLAAARERRGAN